MLLSNPSGATIADGTAIGTITDWTPVIASGAAPAGAPGEPYSFMVPASRAPPLSYSATGLAGTGLSIDAGSGEIAGTPLTLGSHPVTVTVSNGLGSIASADYTIVIAAAPAMLSVTGSTAAPWGSAAALVALGLGLLVLARWRSGLQRR